MGFFDTFKIIRKRKVKKVAINCAPPFTGNPKLDSEFLSLWRKGAYKELYKLAKENADKEYDESLYSNNESHRSMSFAYLQVAVRAFAVMKFDELLASNQPPEDYTINLWAGSDVVRGEDVPLVDFIIHPKRVSHFGEHLYKKA